MQFILENTEIECEQIKEIALMLSVKDENKTVTIKAVKSGKNICSYDGAVLNIEYSKKSYIYRAFAQLVCNDFKHFNIIEQGNFERLGVMVDCSRNGVHTISSLKAFIRILAICGYDSLQLYTEDTYKIDGEPYFGYLRGGYSKTELKEVNAYANSYGIELIPCIQTLAHLGSIFRWKDYSQIHDVNDILLVNDEKTYKLIEKMFATIRECFTTNIVNIGMDEAFMLGMGKYFEKHGAENRTQIMLKHLGEILKIAKKYNFECAMWSDMYYRLAFGGYYDEANGTFPQDMLKNTPKDVKLIYWDYYSKSQNHYEKIISQHKNFCNDIWFAGAFWTFLGFLPNNSFSIEASKTAINACKNKNIKNIMFTMWGDFGAECSIFAVLPTILCTAEYAFGNDNFENIKLKFERLFGIPFDAFMLLEQADKIGNITNVDLTDPSKYLLYNDCFAGILDTSITITNGTQYADLATKLIPYIKHDKWGDLFKFANSLCNVLEYKATLGILTRKYYNDKNLPALKKLIKNDYTKLIVRLKEFYESFSRLWHKEKKSYSFEISNYRIGGLIARVQYCKSSLQDFCNRKIEKIDQLEENLLDFFGNKEQTKQLMYYNEFLKITSVNNFN